MMEGAQSSGGSLPVYSSDGSNASTPTKPASDPHEDRPFNVYVKNFSASIDNTRLEEIFSAFGSIQSCAVLRDHLGRSKQVGFVQFTNADEVESCIQAMHGKYGYGRGALHVAATNRKPVRSKRRGIQPSDVTPLMAPNYQHPPFMHPYPMVQHHMPMYWEGPLPFMMVPQHDYYAHHSYLTGHYPPYFYPPQSYSPNMQGPALQTPGFSSGPGFSGGSRSAEPTPIQYYYPHGGPHYQPMHFIPPSPMPSPASDASSATTGYPHFPVRYLFPGAESQMTPAPASSVSRVKKSTP